MEGDTVDHEVPRELASGVVGALVSFGVLLASVALAKSYLESSLVTLAVIRPKPL